MVKNIAYIGALVGWTGLAVAQAPATPVLSEKDFLADMPIVLSVSRLPQRLDETPGAVTILDRDMIRRSGARDVADLLRMVPGFQTNQSFESGAPIASYHGVFERFSGRIQVMVDGRSVYSPFYFGGTGFALQVVALEDIDRIEVLRGSNSAAYGSRAMLGVVNIVTRNTVATLGTQVALTVGENGIRDAQTHIGWGAGDSTFRIGLDRRGDDGLIGSNGHNEISRVNFRADMRGTIRDEVRLSAGGLAIDAGKGFDKVNDPFRDRAFKSRFMHVEWRHIFDTSSEVSISASHTQETHADNYTVPFRGDKALIAVDGWASSDVLNLRYTARHGDSLFVVIGGEFQREQVSSSGLFNTDATYATEFRRLFGNAEWKLGRDVAINVGAMAESSSLDGSNVSPRMMLNWRAAPGQTLRVGMTKAYRRPSTFEKFGDVRYRTVSDGVERQNPWRSTGSVQPESVLIREIGFLGEFPQLGLSLDARAFHEETKGFVERAGRPFDFVNTEGFAIKGLEYQLKSTPWSGAQFIVGQAFIDIGSFSGASGPGIVNAADTIEIAGSAPKVSSTLTLFQKLPGGLDLSLLHQRSGSAHMAGGGGYSRISRTDLRLAMPLRLGGKRGEIAIVAQNLNSPNLEYVPTFRFERRAFVTLRLEN